MGFPYTDVGAHYPTGPLAGDLIDVEAAKNIGEQNTVLVASGGSPSGNGTYRGPVNRQGSPGGWFQTGLGFGSVYDVRGLTSHAMVCWIRLNLSASGPQAVSVWDITAANHEAWVLYGKQNAAPAGPAFQMYDGLSQGNNILVKAAVSASPSITDFHMIGGGFDAVRKKIMCFWGDGADATGLTTHYTEVDGFVAGYGPLIDVSNVNCGRFAGDADPGFDIDLISHWKGRAFDEQDFLNHWQLGTGLARDEFLADPGRGGGGGAEANPVNYYYNR